MSLYVLGGLALGVVLIVVYLIQERKGHPGLSTAAALLVSGIGIGTGIKVMVLSVTVKSLPSFGEDDRAFVFIGGGAVIWVSVEAILRSLRGKQDV